MQHEAKKSLGQNFLKSETALRKIIEAGEIKREDVVLEIGPGRGALTKKLLEKVDTVIAVEKDKMLYEILKEKFIEQINSRSLVLVHDDILNFNANTYSLKPSAYKVIANIPYNITGAILKKFLTENIQPELMVLMVQHDVAKRILARDEKESILSISVKAYGEPKMIMKVEKRYFSPQPKVDSAVIKISNISRKMFIEMGSHALMDGARHDFAKSNEERFWETVKTGFAHKRKKLSSNLKGMCQRDTLTSLGNKRAEDLSLLDWIKLAKNNYP